MPIHKAIQVRPTKKILGGGTRKKNKEKKGAGVGRKKLGWGRGVEYLGVGGPDPPVLLHHIA